MGPIQPLFHSMILPVVLYRLCVTKVGVGMLAAFLSSSHSTCGNASRTMLLCAFSWGGKLIQSNITANTLRGR